MAVRERGEAPFEAWYERYWDKAYRLALRYGGGSRAFAEDVAQDVFVALYRHRHALHREDDPGGFIHRTCVTLSLKRLQRERSLLGRLQRFVSGREEHDEASPDQKLELEEDARAAMSALRGLPPKEHMALSLSVMEGRTGREIAGLLGLSEGYVSKLLTRAWRRMEEQGWEMPR